MNGILPLWKPKGMTSHDCVMRVRRLYKTKKCGHTGTLDPEAEGMLPICLGQATKIVPFLVDTKKTYLAEVSLGAATDTEDGQGQVVEQKPVTSFPPHEEIDHVLQSFKGTLLQTPPMYSAVKVKGKKLYEYARENKEVERPVREVTIHDIRLLSGKAGENCFKIEVVCSKGTYIRTLCADIGKRLGYPAHMADLTRTQTASFSEETAVDFETIEAAADAGQAEQLLVPLTAGLGHMDKLEVDSETKMKVKNGRKLPQTLAQHMKTDPFMVLHEKELLAIYQTHPEKHGQIKPVRVFPG
ncbi:tRNA pseudouridine(55) synthase TruB [Lentibacillus sediminis]|uniref:tRNA pseudouridine(55) synthase TruB n=1 Tax=Lentibacillus sediminis TaxID=1940529 RepID=UPI000C1C32FB|nr:tRNA pseudouridine(55) synthase TruB [Lentibacillus sediminis]